MEPEFNTAMESDFAEILQMMKEFNAIDNCPFDKEISENNLREFIQNKYLGKLWTISNDNIVIGYIILTFGFSFEYKGRDAFIDEFFIKESYRNKGVGKKTMEFITMEAKDLGVNTIHLEVKNSNENANRLYFKSGYIGNNRSF